MSRRSVLVVDDDPQVRPVLARAVRADGRIVRVAEDAEAALEQLERARADVMLLDVRLPGMSGIDLLGVVRARMPEIGVVMISAYGDRGVVHEAMRLGAIDFIAKPCSPAEIRPRVGRAFEVVDNLAANGRTAPGPREPLTGTGHAPLIGRASLMVQVFRQIEQFAPTNATIVILGETGTG